MVSVYMLCDACIGGGTEIVTGFDPYTGRDTVTLISCPYCDGTGSIEPPIMEWEADDHYSPSLMEA